MGEASSPLLFAGQYEDQESGWVYNRYRYYNTKTGVYNAQDPLGLWPNLASSQAYVSNPTVAVDVFGLKECSSEEKSSGTGGDITENHEQGKEAERLYGDRLRDRVKLINKGRKEGQEIQIVEQVALKLRLGGVDVRSYADFILYDPLTDKYEIIELKSGNARRSFAQKEIEKAVKLGNEFHESEEELESAQDAYEDAREADGGKSPELMDAEKKAEEDRVRAQESEKAVEELKQRDADNGSPEHKAAKEKLDEAKKNHDEKEQALRGYDMDEEKKISIQTNNENLKKLRKEHGDEFLPDHYQVDRVPATNEPKPVNDIVDKTLKDFTGIDVGKL